MSEPIYYKIRLLSLHHESPLPFDLFVLINSKYIQYLHAGDTLSKTRLIHFKDKAPDSFYINENEKQNYKDYIQKQLNSDHLDIAAKAIILKESTFSLIEELFEKPNVGEVIKESAQIISTFIEFMNHDPRAMANLISLSKHDFYTYNHSLDVGIYSLGLGHLAGYREKDLITLGEGALFHDIGKRNIDISIITKSGSLTSDEWAEMQKHPGYGLQILSEYDVPTEVKSCCFEHHESMAGDGYPMMLPAKDIHPMAKIVSICDTYDALTTRRSYQEPMSPTQALELMNTKLKHKYDPSLLKAMISISKSKLKAS